MLVEAWLARAAATRPRGVALDAPGVRCTYAELYDAARAGSHELAERGVRAGERVAIALPAGVEFARALHACLQLGAIAVPVDLRLSAPERERVSAGASLVLDEPLDWDGELRDGELKDVGPSDGEPSDEEPNDGERGARHELERVALVIHTSGTSSAPRPIELTYGNLLWSALGSAVALGLDPNERWLCALPVSHVGGVSILIRSAIYATTAVIHERFETEPVLHELRERDVTLVSLVATTLARLLDAGLREPPALRCALTGGGPVPASLLERAREAGVSVSLTYGLTESCSQVTTTPVAALARGELGPGPPLFCTRVRTLADGEILVSSPTVAPASADADGWLATGDLGELDSQNRLRVTGRKADTIISGGENVAPAEVEAVLEGHPDVLEAAVLAEPDETWGEAVTAIVVPRDGRLPAGEELIARCAGALAPYKVPKRVVLRAEPLPRTASGKLLRRELR